MAKLIQETRGGVVELEHSGSVVLATERIVRSVGSDDYSLCLRSMAKPFILGALLDGPLKGEHFTDVELAFMSSSHNGEARHVAAGLELLERYKISPELLKCGCQEPWKPYSITSPLGHNCSGKHIALLVASRLSGFDLDDYTSAEGNMHQYIKLRMEGVFGVDVAGIGVDGCSVPTYSFPIATVASVFQRYASDTLGDTFSQVRRAHTSHPYFVGGTDRLESYLIGHYGLAVKSGSDGVWAIGIPSHQIGLVAKVWSGSELAVQHALLVTLHALKVIDVTMDPYLTPYVDRGRFNNSGQKVGTIQACFEAPRAN